MCADMHQPRVFLYCILTDDKRENEQLIMAESAVAQATSHLELTRALVGQAHVTANEASHAQTAAHKNSQVRCCD